MNHIPIEVRASLARAWILAEGLQLSAEPSPRLVTDGLRQLGYQALITLSPELAAVIVSESAHSTMCCPDALRQLVIGEEEDDVPLENHLCTADSED